MECPYCGTENRSGVRYCSNCGKALAPGQAQTGQGPAGGATQITSSSLTPGSHLQNNRYVVERVLGEGGMGAALLAEDTRLDGKQVVIKELISDNTDPTKTQEDVRNFKREVSTLVQIDHPLVPNVTDHFQEGSHYFMVQEYVAGENLEDILERTKRPMKEQDVLTYASQLLDILDYLEHRKPPIVHRDVKPANVIIGANDKRAHLVDFGIARADIAQHAARKQTSALGTPGYAPPEQYKGNADGRSDLYALAATMHHILTNRDPREEPPFTYPPVRTLNSQLSPDIERVLSKALTIDMASRYQTAAEMKRDIDDILQRRFGTMGETGSYILGTSGPMNAVNLPGAAATAPNQTTRRVQQPAYAPPPPPAYAPPPPRVNNPPPARSQQPAYQPTSIYGGRGRSGGRRNNVGLNFLIFVVVIAVIAAIAYGALGLVNKGQSNQQPTPFSAAPTPTPPAPTVPAMKNGLGAFLATNPNTNAQEHIGVSDGRFAFDTGTDRADSQLKQQAAERFAANDVSTATTLWQQAVTQDSNDAESLIYLEDQRVLNSGSSYVTFVVGTMLSGDSVSVGREDLQGAYIAQKEFNASARPGGLQLRLLIASSGSQATYATSVANQIVQAAQADKSIVGVIGWPFSAQAIDALGPLARAHIPMVSQGASTDLLTSASPYFFRVCPSNIGQGAAGASYAAQKLKAKKVALFLDTQNPYSNTLANDFSKPFTSGGGSIVVQEQYTVGKSSTLPGLLQDALTHSPDLIYFAGYPSDVSALLAALPTTGQFAQLQVLGGDALYQPTGYTNSKVDTRLHFTAFAYPDSWGYLGHGNQQPSFFNDYVQTYNPQNLHSGYGYTRAGNDTQLSFDAVQAMVQGSQRALSGGKQSITGDELRTALASINTSNPIQGVSGQIAFGADGNPVNKAIIVLSVIPGGFIQIASIQGKFFK